MTLSVRARCIDSAFATFPNTPAPFPKDPGNEPKDLFKSLPKVSVSGHQSYHPII